MTPTREPSVTANEAAERLRVELNKITPTDERLRAFRAADAALRTERLRVVVTAVRYASHGNSAPPNDPCESCVLAVDEVLAMMGDEVAGLTGEEPSE